MRASWTVGLTLTLLLGPAAAAADAPRKPPDPPTVVLYTIGPGADLFEEFGHTSLCLHHPRYPQAARCFDYGTADFAEIVSTGWRFLRGRGSFRMSTDAEAALVGEYARADRAVWRQVLPLTPEQAEAVRVRLLEDARDPAWRYPYRLYDDNCATRVRDVLDAALGGRLRAATAGRPGPGLSFREIGRRGFAEQPLGALILDLFLTRDGDRLPDQWEAMFLPEQLRDGVRDVLGVAPELLRARRGRPLATDPGWGGRGWLLLLALGLAAPLALALRFGRGVGPAVAWAVLPLVVLAAAVWFVAWACPWPEGRVNELLTVFVPWDIVLPFVGAATRRRYARVRIALLAAVSLLAAIGVFVQPLWAPLLVVFAPMAALAFVPSPPAADG